MMDRRTVLKGTAAAAAVGPAKIAPAASRAAPPIDRGRIGDYRRLPSLDAESRLDFLWGIESYNFGAQARAADARAEEIMAASGHDRAAETPMAQAVAMFGPDPLIAARYKTYLDSQRLKMKLVRAALARDEAHHVAALDEAMTRGPGSLTLDPGFRVPDYARHELHMQPGGYVGDPLAGIMFRHAIVGLHSGHNFQNETHESIASIVPVPADGRVLRILELGCGIGQLATALQKRFPAAELWGVDTSAPMLRYAHLRATELASPVHFVQQSAEAMGFADGSIDLITASGLFHEIAPEATRAIIAEVARVLRPGGTFYPLDLNTAGPPGADAKSRFATWFSYRWYHEDWRNDYAAVDLNAEMRRVGLEVNEKGPALKLGGYAGANVMATKPAGTLSGARAPA